MVPSTSAPLDPPLAARNLDAALNVLGALIDGGVRHLVVCPGSRSAPLASAAGLLVEAGRACLHTAIDERSAAFFALGLGLAHGAPAALITTSGTAVANLLPAAVEADFGGVPLLLLTADRPARLKGCGANQTVNQESFLASSVRWLGQGDSRGLAAMDAQALASLATRALGHCRGAGGLAPGPVHLNLPFEEPLHATAPMLRHQALGLAARAFATADPVGAAAAAVRVDALGPVLHAAAGPLALDPDRPGVVVAGPWRGHPQARPAFLEALKCWQRRTGWPVLADGLSGLRGDADLDLVCGYDLVGPDLPAPLGATLAQLQVLRLGPLPASRRLQALLQACGGAQVLVSEGDPRPLDPLGRCRGQFSAGLARWFAHQPAASQNGPVAEACRQLAVHWRALEQSLQGLLDQHLLAGSPAWGEPALARQLAARLPEGLPLVLANSSPVRDWESFSGSACPARPMLGCRGASGIDGTLSIAAGVAEALGRAVLLTGDLALLHDSNGWLWHRQLHGRLLVVLIDNGGGGIFEQLPIRPTAPSSQAPLDFERLFAMPQAVDQAALAAAHGVPSRTVGDWQQLEAALAWGLEQPLALVVLRTDRRADAAWRQALRRMACSLVDPP